MRSGFSRIFIHIVMIVAAVFCVAARLVPAFGQGGHMILTGPGVAVYFPEALLTAAEKVRASYPEIKADTEKVLDWDMNQDVSIVLVDNSSSFEMSVGTPHIVAYAVPGRSLIVVDYRKLQSHPFTLQSVVMHELFHLLLHRHIPSDLLPRWFEEGVCQWASDGLGEIVSGGGRALDPAIIREELFPFRFIDRSFPRDPAAMRLAYEQSKSFVTYLVANYGRESLIEILTLMKEGRDLGTATESVLGKSPGRLEEDWRASLAGPLAWLRLIAHNLYGLVFALAAVLAVAGFVRVIVRKRRAFREYEDSDEHPPAQDDSGGVSQNQGSQKEVER